MSELLPTDEQIHSDTALIQRWLASQRLANPRWARYTRRAAVQKMFAVGSTSAAQICRRHGFDPDEKVRA